MVFATEFDPQPMRARTLPTKSASAAKTSENRALKMPTMGRAAFNHTAFNHTASDHTVLNYGDNVVNLPSSSQTISQPPVHWPVHWGLPAARRVSIQDDSNSLALPRQPKLSLRLQLFHRLQQASTVVTSLLVTGALVVYGSTVYVDKSTNRALVQLDELQGESQQLTSANESIKESLAQQAAQEKSGLEPYESGDVLFLTPAPRRERVMPAAPVAAEMPGPLSY